jgi:hypothetical protein
MFTSIFQNTDRFPACAANELGAGKTDSRGAALFSDRPNRDRTAKYLIMNNFLLSLGEFPEIAHASYSEPII